MQLIQLHTCNHGYKDAADSTASFFFIPGWPGPSGPRRPPQNKKNRMQLNQLHHLQLNQLHYFHIFYYETFLYYEMWNNVECLACHSEKAHPIRSMDILRTIQRLPPGPLNHQSHRSQPRQTLIQCRSLSSSF